MKTILVVDDEPSSQRLIAEYLSDRGFRTIATNNIDEALGVTRSEIPDLILLDIMMPRMSGWEVIQRMKADDKLSSIPVLFLTATPREMDKVAESALDAEDYIAKPFSKAELVARIEDILRRAERETPSPEVSQTSDAVIAGESDADLFYNRAMPLDVLKRLPNPSAMQIQQVLDALKDPALANYFFHDLQNPAWVKILHNHRIFQNAPKKVYVDMHSYTYSAWAATMYLSRVAEQAPADVAAVISDIETDNPAIQRDIIEAALRMSASSARAVVPSVKQWLDKNIDDFLIRDIARLLDLLTKEEQFDSALDLFEALLTPKQIETVDRPASYIDARLRYNFAWLQHVVAAAQPLLMHRPAETLQILRAQLKKANVQIGGHSYWRQAIEDHKQNDSYGTYLGTLLYLVRDLMQNAIAQGDPEVSQLVRSDLDSNLPIFRRLAIHLARLFPDELPDVVDVVFKDRKNFEDVNIYHEFNLLLKEQFPRLSTTQQDEILKWICEGPSRRVDGDTKQRWINRRLFILKNYLPGDLRNRLEGIDSSEEDEDAILFSVYHAPGTFMSAASPKSEDDLNSMSDAELIDFLAVYEDESEYGDSKRELGQRLSLAVAKQPQRYAVLAPQFLNLPQPYTYCLLGGLANAWKARLDFDWIPVLDLCEHLVEQFRQDQGGLDSQSTGTGVVLGNAAALFKAGVQADEFAVPGELLPRIKDILLAILSSKEDATDLQWALRPDSDPVHLSINTEHGKAMEALLSYALHYARTHFPKTGGAHAPLISRLEDEVKTLMTNLLDEKVEPNPSVRVWYGAYLPQLMYLDQAWLVANLSRIFPDNLERIRYWRAAWEGYLFHANRMYQDIFKLVRPQYQRAIEIIANGLRDTAQPKVFDSNRRLAEHLAILYLSDQENLTDDESLLKRFLEVASGDDRADVVLFFANKSVLQDATNWPKLKEYWENRVQVFEKSDDMQEFNREAQFFCMWLEHVPESLDKISTLIESIGKMQGDVWAGARDILEYLAKNRHGYPVACGRILRIMLDNLGRRLQFVDQGNITAILEAMIESKDREAVELAREIVNLFGELGVYAYKSILYPQP